MRTKHVGRRRNAVHDIVEKAASSLGMLISELMPPGSSAGGRDDPGFANKVVASLDAQRADKAVLHGLLVGVLIERELTWKKMPVILEDSVVSSATIMIIMNAAGLFSWLLNKRIPMMIANLFVSMTSNPLDYLILDNIFLLGAGAI